MTGLGFIPCHEDPKWDFCKGRVLNGLGAFVTINFASGSNSTISGYTVGGTYAFGSHLRLLAGFSLAPISEISPGFAMAASQYVTKNNSLFLGVSPANLASNAYGAFDGIQTTSTAPASGAAASNVIYYSGSITETHYRGGFVIGVAMSIDVYKLLSGSK
jgi:hypothetical protein